MSSTLDPVPLPLALQYCFTNGCCLTFASALATHACAEGAVPAAIMTCDPSYLERIDYPLDMEAELHVVLATRRGTYIDAEGERGWKEICCDFGISSRYSRLATKEITSMDPALESAIHDLLNSCKWDRAIPIAREGRVSRAKAWRKGGSAFRKYLERFGMIGHVMSDDVFADIVRAAIADMTTEGSIERLPEISHRDTPPNGHSSFR